MGWSSTMLGTVGLSRVAWVILGVGTALLSVAWLYLMLSRRGATRPVAKCVVLSIGAHLILLGVASLMQWFPVDDGASLGRGDVHVLWIDDIDGETGDPTTAEMPAEEHRDTADVGRLTQTEAVAVELRDPRTNTAAEATSNGAPGESLATTLALPDLSRTTAGPPEVVTSERDDDTPVDPPSAPDDPLSDAEAVLKSTETPATKAAAASESRVEEIDSNVALESAAPAALSTPAAAVDSFPPSLAAVPEPPAWRAVPVPQRYAARTTDNRRQLAAARGGSGATEAAVDGALSWLARAQNPHDGRWDNRAWEGGFETRDLGGVTYGVKADTAVTGLALLAFLGAGHTHQQGPYQENVRRGLQFLLQSQSRETGSLAADGSHFVAMYCHGIATLALSEAMIMTQDRQLQVPLLRAIDYTVRSQHPVTGGWRYQPGDLGDTSQFGWQLMALLSAEAAGIAIPEGTWNGARRWLDRVALGQSGGLACYTPDRPVASPSMTAEALFCRTFMRDLPSRGAIDEAAEYVARHGQRHEAHNDLYFCYYATLALYQLQDERWELWNQSITRHLVATQRSHGTLAGSWDCDTRWGRVGGRVYTTSMACLCLETYYRYLPVLELAATRGRAIGHR